MTGPSAIGSLNGTPSSINVAPACDSAMSSRSVVARSGSPAVMNGMRPFFPCCFKAAKTSAMRPKLLRLQNFAHGIYVLVTTSGKVHDYHLIALHLARRFQRVRNCVCGLERRNDSLKPRQQLKRLKGFAIRNRHILDAAGIVQKRMLRANRRIIKTSGDGMSRSYLAVVVLQDVAHRSLQHSGAPAAARVEARRVLAQLVSRAAGFDADHLDGSVAEKWMKQTNRVGAAADTRDQRIRQTTFAFQNLRTRFTSDHTVKIAHHERVRMWTKRAAEQVVGIGNIRDPIAQRFVDRILQCARTGIHFAHFSTEQLHAKDVQLLASHVFGAHVDHAIETEERADSRSRNAVLARAGFRDDALLVHATRQQHLADRVVDFVRAGVKQIFAFQVDGCAAAVISQTRRVKERRRTTGEVLQKILELRLKRLIISAREVSRSQLFERSHQGLGHEPAAVLAPVTEGVWLCD